MFAGDVKLYLKILYKDYCITLQDDLIQFNEWCGLIGSYNKFTALCHFRNRETYIIQPLSIRP